MEDRFKFRVWDRKIKKLNYEVGVCGGEAVESDGAGYYHLLELMPLMQCTGLKDKNGKLIYEGDIMRSEYGYDGTPYIIEGVVRFGKTKSRRIGYFIEDLHENQKIYFSDFEKNEIVGNIYENPELLGQI